ncbi:MAG: PEP-CTERM sorting domain-containing protein [Syntrophobacteraceae bacterium]
MPEPSTMLLMGAGLIGAALIGRRKSAKKDAIA